MSKRDIHEEDVNIPENVFKVLDRPFTNEELELCIRRLKRDKSTSIDKIMNKYMIFGKDILKPVLCKLFDKAFVVLSI